jgi:hypothetical protein
MRIMSKQSRRTPVLAALGVLSKLFWQASLLVLVAASSAVRADTKTFDPQPWIDDLHQIRAAFAEKYANFEWAVFEREIDLSDLFTRTEARLRDATGDDEAKAAIDRLTRILGDGHVRVRWPAIVPTPQAPSSVCQVLGYDGAMSGRALGPHIPGYHALSDEVAPEFPTGFIQSARQRVGVIRIGLFSPQGFPGLCAALLEKLSIAPNGACDQQCADRVESAAYRDMSRDLATRIRTLAKLGATTLLIDLTGNGGGSQWAEAAARIVSPVRLRSERRDFVRGQHWASHWESIAKELRQAQGEASEADRANIERWALQADRATAEATTSCSSEAFWSGRRPDCQWLADGFYATGLLGEGDAAALRKKPWGALVFSPAQYEFEEAVWHGPLLLLVDGGTGSAAEEFVAVLQDNKAAVVIGAPTAGAGCGHTDGGTPTTLTHSGGVLELPDCARIRLDGSNEVMGVDPEILVGFRSTDGLRRKGLRLAPVLPRGISAAVRLCDCGHE